MMPTYVCFFLGMLIFVTTGVGSQRQPVSPPGAIHPGVSAAVTRHGKMVVCYVSSWAVYRPGRGSFSLEELEPALNGCSHLVYAFAGLNASSNSLRSLDPFRDLEENYGKGTYRRMTGLRRRYPHLKVTLAVGGWNEGSANYSMMASTANTRGLFVSSALDFIKNYDFDGLDLDWEYPGKRGGKPEEDKKNFVALVRELREAFNSRGWILTAAFGAAKDVIDTAYDIKALAPHMDLFHIMCYDYHGAWDKRTGHNAPLHQSLQATDPNDKLFNVEYSIKYLLELGAPPKKVVLGVPFYGRTFVLNEVREGESMMKAIIPGVSAKDKGFQGPFTREDGFLGYNEICLELMGTKDSSMSEGHSNASMENKMNAGWQVGWDEVSKTPYASKGDRWFSYDDERSIKEKVKFAMANDLGGVMVWAIDTDDFHGDCGGESGASPKQFPLINAINEAIEEALTDKTNEIPDGKEEPTSGSSPMASVSAVVLAAVNFSLLIHTLFV